MRYEVRCLQTGEWAEFEYSREDGGGYVVRDARGVVSQTNLRSADVLGDGFDTLRDARREGSGPPAIGRELVPHDGDHVGGGPVG